MKTKKVKIRSKEWFEKNCTKTLGGYIKPGFENSFTFNMSDWCGKIIELNKTGVWIHKGMTILEWMCEPDTWKNEKIGYEMRCPESDRHCLTKCPYVDTSVNGFDCEGGDGWSKCKHFVKVDKKKQIVTCSYKKDKVLEAKPLKIRIEIDKDILPFYNKKDMQKAYKAGGKTIKNFDKWIKDFK